MSIRDVKLRPATTPCCESCKICKANWRFLSTLGRAMVLPTDSIRRVTASLKFVLLSQRRQMYSTSIPFFLTTLVNWDCTAHSRWAACPQMPAPPGIGLFMHRIKLVSSVLGQKALQHSMHLHSRQNPGSEQQIVQARVSVAPDEELFPVSRLQWGFCAWHRFRGLCQLFSPALGGLSRFTEATFGADETTSEDHQSHGKASLNYPSGRYRKMVTHNARSLAKRTETNQRHKETPTNQDQGSRTTSQISWKNLPSRILGAGTFHSNVLKKLSTFSCGNVCLIYSAILFRLANSVTFLPFARLFGKLTYLSIQFECTVVLFPTRQPHLSAACGHPCGA